MKKPFVAIVDDDSAFANYLRTFLSLLGITGDVASLRYQLLHRSAAALIEAKAASAREALLVVQSFSPADRRAGFADFAAFTELMGAPVSEPGGLSSPVERAGTRLRFGWAQDRVRGG